MVVANADDAGACWDSRLTSSSRGPLSECSRWVPNRGWVAQGFSRSTKGVISPKKMSNSGEIGQYTT